MKSCIRCGDHRILKIDAKCDDRCSMEMCGYEIVGCYPINVENISLNGYIRISICLHCGQAQGDFPKSENSIHKLMEKLNDDN